MERKARGTEGAWPAPGQDLVNVLCVSSKLPGEELLILCLHL